MPEPKRMLKPRPVLAAVLTLIMTAVWVTFPIGEINAYRTGELASLDTMSTMLLRLTWLGISVASIPALAYTPVPLGKVWPRAWRVVLIYLITFFTVAVLFMDTDVQPVEPSMDLVLMSVVVFLFVCGPAWWFNIIKPLVRGRKSSTVT